MRVALIGRTVVLAQTGFACINKGHTVPLIVTARESPETVDDRREIEFFAKRADAELVFAPKLDDIGEIIERHQPLDIALSVNYVSVIQERHIEFFKLGVLNAHGGDLPRYRGNACQAWAIMNGEASISLCVHRMIGGELDAGDIIARERMVLSDDVYINDVYTWMHGLIPEMLVSSAEHLDRDPNFVLEKQNPDPSKSLRTYPRRPSDGRIDWARDSTSILRLVRASGAPFSGAFSYVENRVIRVLRAVAIDYPPICSIPGQIVRVDNESFDVSTGDGSSVIRVTVAAMDDGSDWRDSIRSIRSRLAS
jgi:UDP-4-amino-4-deoxy-L-arabinose formyltransferase/UDP-glucuronic acid dehydrogenase (UDP-4-keto-hexauronic acid decarboxylating)